MGSTSCGARSKSQPAWLVRDTETHHIAPLVQHVLFGWPFSQELDDTIVSESGRMDVVTDKSKDRQDDEFSVQAS